ncbi:hepatic lectin-like isoform X2 [Heterodontus francisci]|uniref:hepatic lectin-like isoform X2 n=1 Tax=Heterodontus francisci TaxID=7792 RepID=UPI00355B2D0F
MAGETAIDYIEDFDLDSQQNQQQAKWIPDSRFKSHFCGKGLMLLIFIILSVLLILLIIGVIKCSEADGTVEEVQSQVQMQISQALNNVLTELSRKIIELMNTLSRKVEMLPEPGCQNIQCPRNWIHFNESCYYFSTKADTWKNSKLYCTLRESNLLVINTAEEQYFLTLESENKRFWIGLHDQENEHVWQWVDGTDYERTLTFWNEGEPNNAGNTEDCVHTDDGGKWNDNSCSAKFLWICELKAKST